MLGTFYFRLRFKPFLHNSEGAKAMAELLLTRLTRDVVEEAGPIRSRNANLQFEREHLLGYLAHSVPGPVHSASLLGRMLASMVLMAALTVSVTYLYFTALADWMSAALPGKGLGMVAAGLLAVTLAGGAMYACNGVVQATFSVREEHVARRHMLLRGTLWTLLLGCTEMIVLLLMVGASQGAGTGTAVLPFRYAGPLVALLLPILGGFLSIDLGHAVEVYRASSRLHGAEVRIAEIGAEMEQNRATWQHSVRCKALTYWGLYQSFAVRKGAIDALCEEPRPAVPFDSFEAFFHEAERRFQADAVELMGTPSACGDGVLDLKQPRLSVPVRPASHGARQAEDVQLRWTAQSAV